MKPGKYGLKELFKDRNVDRIVVPEIQRDYVWGSEQVTGLLESIIDEFKKFKKANYGVNAVTEDQQLQQAFEDYYKRQKHATNIGFIYAYDDPHYAGNYFLIDGQQRLTTSYLLLCALSILSNRIEEFKKVYFPNNRLKLDYKVRESAHDFFTSFVNFILKGNNPELAIKQNWYYDDYENDVTISSIYNNYHTILNYIQSSNAADLFDYVQDYVEFWYFDTNISEQGEELYIYMNARGEQMQSNENLKASLLALIKDTQAKDKAGKDWEDWQDYFWQNRGENENADKGFNEFLNAIAGFENYKLERGKLTIPKPMFDESGIKSKTLLKYLNLPVIADYLIAFNDILHAIEKCGVYYEYYEWIEFFKEDWWNLFNNDQTNWFADLDDTNRGLEHSRMVHVWSLLYYFKYNKPSEMEAIRFIRLYFIRYYNYDRQVKNIISRVDFYGQTKVQSDTINMYSNDEILKHKFYASLENENISAYEQLIWKIEDHRFNLEGDGLDAVNISHLVDFAASPSIERLRLIAERFYTLFPESEGDGEKEFRNADQLRTTLLYYGVYWHRVSPWYYENYDCANWHRIIRDQDSKVDLPFRTFFNDYLGLSLDEILITHIRRFLIDYQDEINGAGDILPEMPLVDRLIIYSLFVPNLWEKGGSIAVYDALSKPRLFKNDLNKIYNTRGNFKGSSNYVDLWDKCRNINKSKANIIKKLKVMLTEVPKRITV
jgi:uncharacterized protein with ParB-like and HNH nuclease domain